MGWEAAAAAAARGGTIAVASDVWLWRGWRWHRVYHHPPSISVNYRHYSPKLNPSSPAALGQAPNGGAGAFQEGREDGAAPAGSEPRRCYSAVIIIVGGAAVVVRHFSEILMTISSAHNPNLMHTEVGNVQRYGGRGRGGNGPPPLDGG